MTKLILFDIDGTLLITGGIGQESARISLERVFGTSGRVEEIYPKGRTIEAVFRDVLLDAGISEEVYHQKRDVMYKDFFAEFDGQVEKRKAELVPLPGAQEILSVLRDMEGVLLGLVTGNHHHTAQLKLEGAGFDFSQFEVGAFGNEAAHRPDLILMARQRATRMTGLDYSGKATVVIGDTIKDVEAALENDALGIAVATGKSSAEELAEAGPDHLLPDLANPDAVISAIFG